jgi:hypothetical protein
MAGDPPVEPVVSLDVPHTPLVEWHDHPPGIRVDDGTPQFSTSPTFSKLASALARVQKLLKQPSKGADNPFFKSKYADLHDVWSAVRGHLSDEGIAVVQSPSFSTAEIKGKVVGIITISTTIIHGDSGEWMTNVLRGTSESIGPQAIGSAISYFRRYSIQPLLMLTPDDGSDDDAEKAEGRAPPADDKPTPEEIDKTTKDIKAADSNVKLKAVYLGIPDAHKKFFTKLVNARKAALEKAEAQSEPESSQTPASDGTGHE